jgi:hypothetical protein
MLRLDHVQRDLQLGVDTEELFLARRLGDANCDKPEAARCTSAIV